MTHTNGPWGIDPSGYIVAFDDATVAKTIHNDVVNGEELIANGNLIASAPDLLEALRECITNEGANCFATDTKHSLKKRIREITEIANAAIAKAEGR
jgi:hypothetical protein